MSTKALGLSREDAEARLAQMQSHYAESALDAIRAIGSTIESLRERVASVNPANASPSVAYRYGALDHDLRMAAYAAAALIASIEREAKCEGERSDCPVCAVKTEPCF